MTAPPPAVARVGDARATPSTSKNYPNDAAPTATGTWAATAPPVETPLPVPTSGTTALIAQASCTFLFTGKTSANTPFTSPPSPVLLKPGSRVLRIGTAGPLVDGDTAEDTFGNTVSVSSTATWRTA